MATVWFGCMRFLGSFFFSSIFVVLLGFCFLISLLTQTLPHGPLVYYHAILDMTIATVKLLPLLIRPLRRS